MQWTIEYIILPRPSWIPELSFWNITLNKSTAAAAVRFDISWPTTKTHQSISVLVTSSFITNASKEGEDFSYLSATRGDVGIFCTVVIRIIVDRILSFVPEFGTFELIPKSDNLQEADAADKFVRCFLPAAWLLIAWKSWQSHTHGEEKHFLSTVEWLKKLINPNIFKIYYPIWIFYPNIVLSFSKC